MASRSNTLAYARMSRSRDYGDEVRLSHHMQSLEVVRNA